MWPSRRVPWRVHGHTHIGRDRPAARCGRCLAACWAHAWRVGTRRPRSLEVESGVRGWFGLWLAGGEGRGGTAAARPPVSEAWGRPARVRRGSLHPGMRNRSARRWARRHPPIPRCERASTATGEHRVGGTGHMGWQDAARHETKRHTLPLLSRRPRRDWGACVGSKAGRPKVGACRGVAPPRRLTTHLGNAHSKHPRCLYTRCMPQPHGEEPPPLPLTRYCTQPLSR